MQNPTSSKAFDDKKSSLSCLYRSHRVNLREKLLFHGTSRDRIRGICEHNLNPGRSGEVTGRHSFGRGAYFARNSKLSHGYTNPSRDGTYLMIVAKVLVGLECVGDHDMTHPPVWRESIAYDTAVNYSDNPGIFVKFEAAQYYPAYIVQYSIGQ